MAYRVLILGASYGSLFGTKCLMAGHDVTMVCRAPTAELINARGTEVRIKLKGEDAHRAIRSAALPGRLDAKAPENAVPAGYDMVVLAMQEPQYLHHTIRTLLARIAAARIPCLSLMNMPPLPYLKRIPAIDAGAAEAAFAEAGVWDRFDPQTVTLCSPDPQAARPADEAPNVLQVNLATNFKAAGFASPAHNAVLNTLAREIDAARLDGLDVPVKLRVHESLFVPFAKWAMLLTGNYPRRRARRSRPVARDLLRRRTDCAPHRRAARRPGAVRQIRSRRRAADQSVVGRAGHRGGLADGRTGRQTGAAHRPPVRD
jgi:hypothetical protein